MNAICRISSRGCVGRASLLSAVALVLAMTVGLSFSPVTAYAASSYDSVTAEIPVTVEVTGDATDAQTFAFVIEPSNGEAVTPDQPEVSIDGTGEVVFTVSLDEAGEYHYTVRQVVGNADGWTYDDQTYEVTVYSYTMGDQSPDALKTLVIIEDSEGYKVDSCAFTNSYEAADDSVDPDNPGAGTPNDDVSSDDASTTEAPDDESKASETPNSDASTTSTAGSQPTPFMGDGYYSWAIAEVMVVGIAAIVGGVVLSRRRAKQ